MNDAEQRALAIPPAIANATELAPNAHELIRAWWDGQQPRMMIRSTFDDPADAGKLLAELAWHFSKAYGERLGQPQTGVLETIVQGWNQRQATFDGPVVNYADVRLPGGSQS